MQGLYGWINLAGFQTLDHLPVFIQKISQPGLVQAFLLPEISNSFTYPNQYVIELSQLALNSYFAKASLTTLNLSDNILIIITFEIL